MSDVAQKHLEAIAASVALLGAQIEALRHELAPKQAPPVAREVTPKRLPRCQDVPDVRCALMNEDAAQSRSNFSNPHAWQCVGCKYEGATT